MPRCSAAVAGATICAAASVADGNIRTYVDGVHALQRFLHPPPAMGLQQAAGARDEMVQALQEQLHVQGEQNRVQVEQLQRQQQTLQLQERLLDAQDLIERQAEIMEHQLRPAAQPDAPPGVRPRVPGAVNMLQPYHGWGSPAGDGGNRRRQKTGRAGADWNATTR